MKKISVCLILICAFLLGCAVTDVKRNNTVVVTKYKKVPIVEGNRYRRAAIRARIKTNRDF